MCACSGGPKAHTHVRICMQQLTILSLNTVSICLVLSSNHHTCTTIYVALRLAYNVVSICLVVTNLVTDYC